MENCKISVADIQKYARKYLTQIFATSAGEEIWKYACGDVSLKMHCRADDGLRVKFLECPACTEYIHCREEWCIGLYIPGDQEISQDTRGNLEEISDDQRGWRGCTSYIPLDSDSRQCTAILSSSSITWEVSELNWNLLKCIASYSCIVCSAVQCIKAAMSIFVDS